MKPEEIEELKERLRESAGAFRNHNLYDSEGDAFRLVEQADEYDQAASTIEALQAENGRLQSENERLREALATISESHDAGRHDGLPEECPAHCDVIMWSIARQALAESGQ